MGKAVSGRKHSVRCTVQVPELTKAGSSVQFEVSADGEKIGTIERLTPEMAKKALNADGRAFDW